jgi:hypothetical protein
MGKATLMSLTFTSKKVLAQQIITEKKLFMTADVEVF